MYELWAKYRKEHENLAAATTLREKQRWDKYFGGSELSAMRADEITNFQIEDHLYMATATCRRHEAILSTLSRKGKTVRRS